MQLPALQTERLVWDIDVAPEILGPCLPVDRVPAEDRFNDIGQEMSVSECHRIAPSNLRYS